MLQLMQNKTHINKRRIKDFSSTMPKNKIGTDYTIISSYFINTSLTNALFS